MAWPAIVVAKLKRIPLVIHILDQWPISIASGGFSKTSLFYKSMYRLSRNTYRKADVLSISSRKFEKYIKEELKINDIPIIYNPSYAEDTYKDTKYVDNKKFDLLFAGNIGPATSVETIIEAANLLKDKKDIMFHIVGDGLSKDNCARRAAEYKLDNVKFYGFCPVEEVKKYYDIADAFLITMDDNEVVNNTLPAKLQSYMVAAKPIFGAVSGEAKETIIDSKCGLVVSSKDYDGLAEIIRNNYKKDIYKYGKNALKYYEDHFEKEKCLDDMLKMFNKCIKEKKHEK
jgi:glycosyltransferase involved in cell wall biosynthesis